MKRRINLDKRTGQIPTKDSGFYDQSFDDLSNFCSMIEKRATLNQDDPQKVKRQETLMKNWVVVRLVSLLEYHLKALISDLIDEEDINPKRILKNDTIDIDLNFLEHFKLEQWSKGRIIIAHLDKMNAAQIKRLMDRINRLDFFEWYKSVITLIVDEKNQVSSYTDTVFDLYRNRNDVTHNLVDPELSVDNLRVYVEFFHQFGHHLVFFTKLNIGIYEKKWTDDEIMTECSDLPVVSKTKFIQQFKNTTNKFREDWISSRKY